MLTAENLSVRYGETAAVTELSFRIREGEWWVAVGPNGAGKSSLVRALSRTVPCTGTVTLKGRDIRSIPQGEFARKVGVLSQNHGAVYGFTVEEVVSLGRYAWHTGLLRRGDPEGPEKVAEALERTGLSEMRRRSMLTLSGGEQQRVFLAQVLCQDPELLILDEPANHLDLKYQQELFGLIGDWLRRPGRAVLAVVHDLNLARRYGTHGVLLDRGRCAACGTLEEVLTPENLNPVYGMDVFAWMRETLEQWR